MELPPKVCPRCGEEYVHAASRCAECDVELVVGPAEPSPRGSEEEPSLPSASELVPIRVAASSWISGLAARLQEEGIACRVEVADERGERGRAGIRCAILVRPEDAERASQVDAEFARTQIPDLPEEVSPAWTEAETCPACGEALSPEAAACSACGLVFSGEEE